MSASPHGLALPSSNPAFYPSSEAGPSTSSTKPLKRKRPKPRPSAPTSGARKDLDVNRELDEDDDVSPEDLVAAPRERRVWDDYDEEGETEVGSAASEDGSEALGEVVIAEENAEMDVVAAEEVEGEERGRAQGPAVLHGGRAVNGVSAYGRRRDRMGEVVLNGKEMERRTKKRREET